MTPAKHITKQLTLIKLLDEQEIDIFTLEGIRKKFEKTIKNIDLAIKGLTQKGLLKRIEQGKYCRHTFRNEYVIGNYLANDGVIAYWTALNRHGLTEQFPNSIFVQTTNDIREKQIFGVKYKFIRVPKRKLIGFKIQGSGNHQFPMTDLEKTIVDCFDLPEYSGGYAELIRAFNTAQLDAKKMVKYCKAINNIAATKRMAFLAELLKKDNMTIFIDYAKGIVNKKYNPFDPIGLDEGEFVKEWTLRMNISREDILEICNKVY